MLPPDDTTHLRPIGVVESGWVVFEPVVLAGLDGLGPGEEVILLTWHDRASRAVLRVHSRGDASTPARGVFSTRSTDRPNPIGIHRVTILEIDGRRVRVRHLDAADGTPVVDVKPVLDLHRGAV